MEVEGGGKGEVVREEREEDVEWKTGYEDSILGGWNHFCLSLVVAKPKASCIHSTYHVFSNFAVLDFAFV